MSPETLERTRTGSGRPGVIILTRHGEPALSRKIRLSAEGYVDWWARYEEIGLKPGQAPPSRLVSAARDAVILSSTRRRAVESGEAIAAGRSIVSMPALIEAPLPPPRLPRWLKLAPRTWGVIARTWWWFGERHGEETRRQAQRRAQEMADRLIAAAEGGRDVVVIAHGFFNTMVGWALRRRGWRLKEDQGYRYWSARIFERR